MGIASQSGQNFMPEMDPNVWTVVSSSRQINIFKKFYTDAVTLRHKFTGIQLDQYQVQFDSEQSQKKYKYNCQKRPSIPQIVNVVFYTKYTEQKICTSRLKSHIYTEHYPNRLSDVPFISQAEGLYILWSSLVGFAELYKQKGYFQIIQQLIGFNCSGQCKVWINSDFLREEPLGQDPNSFAHVTIKNRSEKYMIEKLIRLLQAKMNNKTYQAFSEFLFRRFQKISLNFTNCKNFFGKFLDQNGIILPNRCQSLVFNPPLYKQKQRQKISLQSQKNNQIQSSKSTRNTRGSDPNISPTKKTHNNNSFYTFSNGKNQPNPNPSTQTQYININPHQGQKNNQNSSINYTPHNKLRMFSNLNPTSTDTPSSNPITSMTSPNKLVQKYRNQSSGVTQLKKIKQNILYSTFNSTTNPKPNSHIAKNKNNVNTHSSININMNNINNTNLNNNNNSNKKNYSNNSLQINKNHGLYNMDQSHAVEVLWQDTNTNTNNNKNNNNNNNNNNNKNNSQITLPNNHQNVRNTLVDQLKLYPQYYEQDENNTAKEIDKDKKRSRSNSLNTKNKLLQRLVQKPLSNKYIYYPQQHISCPEDQNRTYNQPPYTATTKNMRTQPSKTPIPLEPGNNPLKKSLSDQYMLNQQKIWSNYNIIIDKNIFNTNAHTTTSNSNTASNIHTYRSPPVHSNCNSNIYANTNVTSNVNTNVNYHADVNMNVNANNKPNYNTNTNSNPNTNANIYSTDISTTVKKITFKKDTSFTHIKNSSNHSGHPQNKIISVRSTIQPQKSTPINFNNRTANKCKINTQSRNAGIPAPTSPPTMFQKTKQKIGMYDSVTNSFKIDPVIASDLARYMEV